MNQPKPFPLPNTWKWTPFGDCAQLINGRAYKQKELLNSGTPVLRIQNLNGGDSWYYSDLKLPDNKYCEKGDLLYSWSASFGPYLWTGPKAIFHYHIWKVKPTEKLDKNFAFHLLGWVSDVVKKSAHGITMVHMTKEGMENWLVPLPPLPEQRRIAAILDKADAIRRKRREAVKLTDELLRATFLEMFGDPVTNPMGWETTKLGNLLEFLTSGSRGWARYYSDDGRLFIRIQNVGRNQLVLDDVAFVNPPESAEARRTAVRSGDVLLSITADLGRTAVIPEGIGPAHINQHLALMRFHTVDPLFVSACIASEGGQRQIHRLNREGVKAGLNFDDIRSIVLILPPEILQRRFRELHRRCTEAISRLSVVRSATRGLFGALTQRAFRGEL